MGGPDNASALSVLDLRAYFYVLTFDSSKAFGLEGTWTCNIICAIEIKLDAQNTFESHHTVPFGMSGTSGKKPNAGDIEKNYGKEKMATYCREQLAARYELYRLKNLSFLGTIAAPGITTHLQKMKLRRIPSNYSEAFWNTERVWNCSFESHVGMADPDSNEHSGDPQSALCFEKDGNMLCEQF